MCGQTSGNDAAGPLICNDEQTTAICGACVMDAAKFLNGRGWVAVQPTDVVSPPAPEVAPEIDV